MIRTALRPRWLAWLAVALAAVYVCYRLGMWQLGVARDDGAKEALEKSEARPSATLSSILQPHQEWDGRELNNRKVTMSGSYERSGQFLVPDRYLDGKRGYWVVTPLHTTSPDGVIAVVRGWVEHPTAPAAPTGTRTIAGTLSQGESAATGSTGQLPAGQKSSIDLSVLVNEWPGELYNAFAFVSSEQPDAATGLRRVPPPQPESGLNTRNAAYAAQWWIFGLFCPLLWWRMVSVAHRNEHENQPDPETPDPSTDDNRGAPQ